MQNWGKISLFAIRVMSEVHQIGGRSSDRFKAELFPE
jgi:hypothetical protein